MYIRQRVQAPVTRAQRLVVADLDSAAGFMLSSASEAEVLKQSQNTHKNNHQSENPTSYSSSSP
jgi:hypothetical protein